MLVWYIEHFRIKKKVFLEEFCLQATLQVKFFDVSYNNQTLDWVIGKEIAFFLLENPFLAVYLCLLCLPMI